MTPTTKGHIVNFIKGMFAVILGFYALVLMLLLMIFGTTNLILWMN